MLRVADIRDSWGIPSPNWPRAFTAHAYVKQLCSDTAIPLHNPKGKEYRPYLSAPISAFQEFERFKAVVGFGRVSEKISQLSKCYT